MKLIHAMFADPIITFLEINAKRYLLFVVALILLLGFASTVKMDMLIMEANVLMKTV